ncbi:MAG: CoA transferase [Betaproteobacteria bacterium]|nr:CoA transferase [Betaproteobacteria bacterium]
MTDISKPLAGVKVLDFTHLLAGPYCTMLLGDMGADVVKVEPPGGGDSTRTQGPPFHNGQGLTFLAANRNKRSITLDLRDPAGAATAKALAREADIIVENFRPGVMKRLGLDYETLSALHPRLIFCSLSGFGHDGPYAEKGAFDLTVQAIGGYMSITGERDGPPIKLGTSAFDIVAGLHAFSGILAALYQREQTGRGRSIETSLLEGQVAFLINAGLEYLLTGKNPQKWGSEHSQAAPYKAFKAKDGWVAIAAAVQPLFERFVAALGRPDIAADPRFASPGDRVDHREALYALLDALVAEVPAKELMRRLEEAKVPCEPVNRMNEVFNDPQVLHRGMVQSVEHAVYGRVSLIGSAIKYNDVDLAADWRAPPLFGEHTAQVISDWLGTPPAPDKTASS